MANKNSQKNPPGIKNSTTSEFTDEVKNVTGKERSSFLNKINKIEDKYLEKIIDYSQELQICTGLLYSAKKEIKITAINESDITEAKRTVRKTKTKGSNKMFAHCSWSSAEEITIPIASNIVFLNFYCVMITEKQGFVFSKIILNGRTVVLYEGDCEDFQYVIDSFKKKWKPLK